MGRARQKRSEETIASLIDATISCLHELGYAATSTNAICRRAGVSQGGLFNHFATRLDLVVAATEQICADHLQRYADIADAMPPGPVDLEAVVEVIRSSTRLPHHAAWHEVMVAARTDSELRGRVGPLVSEFEQGLIRAAGSVFGLPEDKLEHLGVVALSVMHMFDSEAVTVNVYPNPQIERARVKWIAQMLARELEL